jgi:hypothetical protein
MAVLQDIISCVRPVLYDTGITDFQYATHGGTLFLVVYESRVCALTCAHVFGDFDSETLLVPADQIPEEGAPAVTPQGRYVSVNLQGAAEGSDIQDISVLDFPGQATIEFFKNNPFAISEESAGRSDDGHNLVIFGVLKEKTHIDPPDVVIGYTLLEFVDRGPMNADNVLRIAEGAFDNPEITDITGISGSPVFDRDTGKLCGMVARGKVQDQKAIIYFIDILHILAFLKSSVGGAAGIAYG